MELHNDTKTKNKKGLGTLEVPNNYDFTNITKLSRAV